MTDVAYRHTARVRKDSWYLRFYLWMWEADVERVDFCRLFWGYVFALPNLLVRAVVHLPLKALRFVVARMPERSHLREGEPDAGVDPEGWLRWYHERLAREEAEEIEAEKRRAARRARYEVLFARAGLAADRVVAAAQASWPVVRWPVYALGLALAFFVGAGIVWLVYMLATTWIEALIVAAIFIGAVAAMVATAVGSIYVVEETRVGASLKDNTLGFGGALKTGARGIKGRTCPKIEVVE